MCVCVRVRCVLGCVFTSGQTVAYAISQERKKALSDLIQSRHNTPCVCGGVCAYFCLVRGLGSAL